MNQRTQIIGIVTVINVVAAMTTLICSAYIYGFQDGISKGVAPDDPDLKLGSPAKAPLVGSRVHPKMDCSQMRDVLGTHEETSFTIDEIAEQAQSLAGSVIVFHGQVTHAFPNILGTNWFSLCERPNGPAIVISSNSWVEMGSRVVARGTLSLNHSVGNAYRFPLFIDGASLDGPNVSKSPVDTPTSIKYL